MAHGKRIRGMSPCEKQECNHYVHVYCRGCNKVIPLTEKQADDIFWLECTCRREKTGGFCNCQCHNRRIDPRDCICKPCPLCSMGYDKVYGVDDGKKPLAACMNQRACWFGERCNKKAKCNYKHSTVS